MDHRNSLVLAGLNQRHSCDLGWTQGAALETEHLLGATNPFQQINHLLQAGYYYSIDSN